MERREDREGKWDKNGIAAEAEYTGRPKERRHFCELTHEISEL